MRNTYLTALLSLLGLALLLAPAAAAEKKEDKKDSIVGKWEMTKDTETVNIEFTKDGKVNVKHTKGETKNEASGTYKLTGDKLEVEVEINGEKKNLSRKVKVAKDELTITDDKDKSETFKRVK
jgi:uncharacterized protein (TIGR03066 family)